MIYVYINLYTFDPLHINVDLRRIAFPVRLVLVPVEQTQQQL
jgi:hypothetical protein